MWLAHIIYVEVEVEDLDSLEILMQIMVEMEEVEVEDMAPIIKMELLEQQTLEEEEEVLGVMEQQE